MNKLSAKHFLLFILGVTIISFKTYPSLFITIGGRDTWVFTAIALVIFSLFTIYLIYIATSRDEYDLVNIFNKGLSKPLGIIFTVLFALGLFLGSLESATVEANVLRTAYFLETPEWYIILFFIFPSFFILGKRIRTLLIFVIVTVSSLIINSIILAVLSEQYKDITYLLPVFGQGFKLSQLVVTLLILGSLSSMVISLPFLKYVTRESKMKRHITLVLLVISIFTLYTIIGIISTFGPLRAANIFYPEFIQSQRVQIGSFLEFAEIFFLFQTVVGLFLKYALCSYGIYILFERYIKNQKVYITIYSMAIFIGATFLSRNNFILFDILKYYQLVNILLFIFVPLIAFIAYSIKVKKVP